MNLNSKECYKNNTVVQFSVFFVTWWIVAIFVLLYLLIKLSTTINLFFVVFFPLAALFLWFIYYFPLFLVCKLIFKGINSSKNKFLFVLFAAPFYTLFCNCFIMKKIGLLLFFVPVIKMFVGIAYYLVFYSTLITLLIIPKRIFNLKWHIVLILIVTSVFAIRLYNVCMKLF